MPFRARTRRALFAAGVLSLGCSDDSAVLAQGGLTQPLLDHAVEPEWLSCAAEIARLLDEPPVAGAPVYDEARIAFLGRARGEPMVFIRTPERALDEELAPLERRARQGFDDGRPGGRIITLQQRFERSPESLRRLLLREGYAFFDDPIDGHWFARRVALTDLFTEETIFLHRGGEVFELERRGGSRYPFYAHAGGRREGDREVVLFGDRIATTREGLDDPLHRDVAGFAREQRLDRVEPIHHTESAMVARLSRDGASVVALLTAQGAALRLACVSEPERDRRVFAESYEARTDRADIHARIAEVIDAFESERPEFDRPRGVEGPDRDGELRPHWVSAYLGGRHGYEVDDEVYSVYLPDGRPNPPQVCVDFVLNVYERASGTWFAPLGDGPARTLGTLDFSDLGAENRRGVLALGDFAERHPELFEYHRFADRERVPFQRGEAFFRFVEHEAELMPGDVVTIQGLKADERVHQHAIYVEATDPLTGFPHALADKLGGSYRSTWHDIMAEAPKRSILYRARPTPLLWSKMKR